MIDKLRNEKKPSVKYLVVFLIFFCFLIPILSIYLGNYFIYDQNELNNDQPIPRAHTITKDNYSPILSEEKYGLGNITVENISLDTTFGIGFPFVGGYKTEYNKLLDDLSGDGIEPPGLNMSFRELNFVECNRIAIVDNLNENITDSNILSIKLNESISVQYNMSKVFAGGAMEGFLIYGPRLYPCKSLGIWIQELGSPNTYQITDGNYSIDDGINFIRFNYNAYFGGVEIKNFSLYILWEYNLTVNTWKLTQYADPDLELLIMQQEQTIIPKFNYQFKLNAKKFNDSETALIEPKLPATDVNFKLRVNLPDKDLLTRTDLIIDGLPKDVDTFKNTDNSMNVGDTFKGNGSFSLDFECNFTVRFESAVHYTWAIDRLVSARNIRERIYLPTIVSGPSYIYLKYASIFESTISINQVISNTSLFDRNLIYYDANVTEYEPPTQTSLIFTENATRKKGLEIILPYMIKGEISPFIFKYSTIRNLRIKITDNINMPLVNFKVEIYYFGLIYGTYMSLDRVEPSAPTITDQNGEIYIRNVPNGNYTLMVYLNDVAILETSVSAYRVINYVATDIPHIPLIGIIFSIVSILIILIGLVLYNKKKR